MTGDLHRSVPRGSGKCRSRNTAPILLLCFLACGTVVSAAFGIQSADQSAAGISKAASDSCARKVKALEAFAGSPEGRGGQKTRFTRQEVNSFLALELKSKYHPSLQSLELTFEEDKLRAIAFIDFDKLSMNSTRILTRLAAKLFSGVHSLSVSGKLAAGDGKAKFVLDEARFDSNVLPNFLVEEIITAVGRKQRPPFDPMQPSRMPYAIDRVDVHRDYILVYQ